MNGALQKKRRACLSALMFPNLTLAIAIE